jgi:hypothetical protein
MSDDSCRPNVVPTLHLPTTTFVIVDEAAMVGTDELRELLTATTAANVKTVLAANSCPWAARSSAKPSYEGIRFGLGFSVMLDRRAPT